METTPSPHIGQILRKYVDDHRIRQAAWARVQGIDKDNIRRYFKRPSMETTTIWTVSHVLKYNFFRDISELLPPEFGSKPTAQQQRIAELEEENKMLKNDVALLKELVTKRGL